MPSLLKLAMATSIGAAVLFAVTAGVVLAFQYRAPQHSLRFSDAPVAPAPDELGWSNVGGDAGHLRHAGISQLTPDNVGHLELAWTYQTGEATSHGPLLKHSKFQATPILAAGSLVFCTPFNRIVALDPRNGRERWVHDPEIDTTPVPFNDFNCRGVAQWSASEAAGRSAPCAERILAATNDRRLLALDSMTGVRCAGFGVRGEIQVMSDAEQNEPGEVQIVAAPAVIGDVVIVGSSVADNQFASAASGAVRAFDVQTGDLLWEFDSVGAPGGRTGGGNVWSSISTDVQRGLVFLPTSSPSPDFFGGSREPDSVLTNAMVAIRATTGEVVWSFQTVRHDLWDYDLPAAPTLFDLQRDGRAIPAIAFATKQGFLFVLDRETGAPLFEVTDRAVPGSDVPGERASPTQPFSSLPAIAPQQVSEADAFGVAWFDREYCARRLREHRNEGLFTPPSLRGTVFAPTTGGGANWGGVSIDPQRQMLFVNSNRAVEIISLVSREIADSSGSSQPQRGSPYGAKREILLSPLGLPCVRPPWGAISAIDLRTGQLAWEQPLGTTSTLAPYGLALRWGTPNLGGSISTSGGLLFIAAAMDDRVRAFDTETGLELWSADLPASAQATPMTYAIEGRQFVVVAAGGHSVLDTTRGDYVLAFALPESRLSNGTLR